MRFPFAFPLVLLAALVARAGASPVLDRAAAKWMQERDRWAFTMEVREFDGDTLREVREERFDPSLPGKERWHLLTVDGQTPTRERVAEWQKGKTRHHWLAPRPLSDYFDFEKARALDRTGDLVRYHLPLHAGRAWYFPVDRIALIVTVNRSSLALEKIEAKMDEPSRVALGVARIVDLDLALQLHPAEPGRNAGDPAGARPEGTARLVMDKLGRRFEYAWSDFKRVTPRLADPSETEPGT